MRFYFPYWLLSIPLSLLVFLFLRQRAAREFRRRVALFVAERLRTPFLKADGLRLKHRQLTLGMLAVACLGLALARPLAGLKSGAAHQQGVNLMIAVDGSRSMQVEDAGSDFRDRFQLAQRGIDTLLRSFEGDRAGVIMFGGRPTLLAPITFDTVSLQVMTTGISPELVGRGGSNLAAVIQRAVVAFQGKDYQSKVLVIFTDGEETEGDAVVAAAEAYRKDKIRIFTVGVGSDKGGVIPLYERDERRRWVRYGNVTDPSGQEVISRLDAALLKSVAEAASGSYVDLAAAKGDLHSFYTEQLRPLAGSLEETQLSDLRDWFQIPLILALLALVAEMVIQLRVYSAADVTGSVSSLRAAPAPVAVAVLLLALGLVVSPARGSTGDVQRLMGRKQFKEAFAILQQARIEKPKDPYAAYNYAVGAYALGRFSVAAETLEKLLNTYEPEVAAQSAFQLGNSYYRMGEEARISDPEGAINWWEKAHVAYAKTTTVDGTANREKAHADLLALIRQVAQTREETGDQEARADPEKGIPAWREAIAFLDRAAPLAAERPEGKDIAARKERIGGKIYEAYFGAAEDKQRMALQQHDVAVERALGTLKASIKDYNSALSMRPQDTAAKAGLGKVEALLEPWMVEFGDYEHEEGNKAKALSLDDAFAHWRKAAATFDEVLRKNPNSPGALAGKKRNELSLHDGYVELADRKMAEAAAPALPADQQDKLLKEAMELYEAALAIQPDNPATKQKLLAVGKKLTGVFIARGQAELNEAKHTAEDEKLEPEKRVAAAIPYAEKSIQSFNKGLRFEPTHPEGIAGKKEAEELLKKLRMIDNQEQRKVLANSKELKNAQELKDQGKIALKLLEYDKNKLASKKQQNYSVPENKPLKDW